jgi:UPF0271 protein
MPLIDLANIACGFHGGDPVVMHTTIKLAKQHNIPVGAHPSLPDREGFGRRYIDISAENLFDQIVYQVGAISGMLKAEGMKLNHVKSHGYLWRMCQNSEDHCRAFIKAVQVFDVPMLIISGTRQEEMAKEMGISYIPEFYPDIFYDESGKLMPLLTSGRVPLDAVQEKVRRIISEDIVESKSSKDVKLGLQGRNFSCCIHSDLPHPVETLREVRKAIEICAK